LGGPRHPPPRWCRLTNSVRSAATVGGSPVAYNRRHSGPQGPGVPCTPYPRG
jgi:hypothetical protein